MGWITVYVQITYKQKLENYDEYTTSLNPPTPLLTHSLNRACDIRYDRMTYFTSVAGWRPLGHLYLQLGNLLLLVAFLMPHGRKWTPLTKAIFGKRAFFLLRLPSKDDIRSCLLSFLFCLACGGCLHLAWSWLVLCSLDLALWSLLFITINTGRGKQGCFFRNLKSWIPS